MSLVSSKELLQDAYKRGYAIGMFTITTFGFAEMVVEAAKECNAPAIIGVNRVSFATEVNFGNICHAVVNLIERQNIPLGIHLDHANEFDTVMKAIDLGINSVELDGSELPFEENIRLSKKVVGYAHSRGVSVEGELGHMAGGELGPTVPAKADEKRFTDPIQAQELVERTGIDYLAICIGTVHGRYAETPKLDYYRLEEIKKRVKVPLILHGGSGTPCEMLQRAIALGVTRINIGTDMILAADRTIREALAENADQPLIPNILNKHMDSVKEVVKEKIKCFTVAMLEKRPR